MLLLLNLLNPNSDRIDLKFEDSINDFESFENIFSSLKLTDSLTAEFVAYSRSQVLDQILVQSEVVKLSKQSPFELSAFVTDKWFDVFLFIISSERITKVLKKLFPKRQLNTTSEPLTNLIQHRPKKYDEKRAQEVIDWFFDLPKAKQTKYLKNMREATSLKKIKSIKFKKGSKRK